MNGPSLEQALANAIAAELAGARFYELLAHSTKDTEAIRFFEEMAREEREHADHLRMLSGRMKQAPVESRSVELELPPELANNDENLELEEAVEIALEAEYHAIRTYMSMARATDGEVATLFLRVARTEEQHARILEELRARLLEMPPDPETPLAQAR